MIILTTILRNKSTRKDAAYIVETIHDKNAPDHRPYRVRVHWGKWSSYERDTFAYTGLRTQELGAFIGAIHAENAHGRKVLDKRGRGYRLVAEHEGGQIPTPQRKSILDLVDEAEPVPEPPKKVEPKPEPAPKWDENSMVAKLRRRAG